MSPRTTRSRSQSSLSRAADAERPPPASSRQGYVFVPRSRDGCYVCRARRKKCDCSQNDNGGCNECARLNILCLGYGKRRPQWMQDPTLLNALRAKIRNWTLNRNNFRAPQLLDLRHWVAENSVENTVSSSSAATDSSPLAGAEDLGPWAGGSPHTADHSSGVSGAQTDLFEQDYDASADAYRWYLSLPPNYPPY